MLTPKKSPKPFEITGNYKFNIDFPEDWRYFEDDKSGFPQLPNLGVGVRSSPQFENSLRIWNSPGSLTIRLWKDTGTQKESSERLPIIHFQRRTVSFREGISFVFVFFLHRKSCFCVVGKSVRLASFLSTLPQTNCEFTPAKMVFGKRSGFLSGQPWAYFQTCCWECSSVTPSICPKKGGTWGQGIQSEKQLKQSSSIILL